MNNYNNFLTQKFKAKWLELFSYEYKKVLQVDGQLSLCYNIQ